VTTPGGTGMESRFWAKVDKTSDCWLWTGMTTGSGYGLFWVGGPSRQTRRGPTRTYAHRFAYSLLVEPIPDDLQLDHRHTCPKNCVNPTHLRPATHKQNIENHAGARRNSKSGVRGVYWHKAANRWCVQVTHNRRQHYVGLFDTLEVAETVAIAKRLELHTHNDRDRLGAA
jgi:hypothetical protein